MTNPETTATKIASDVKEKVRELQTLIGLATQHGIEVRISTDLAHRDHRTSVTTQLIDVMCVKVL